VSLTDAFLVSNSPSTTSSATGESKMLPEKRQLATQHQQECILDHFLRLHGTLF
jgi:hypothetical protein